jgi:ribose 5-phosphate isomerase
MIFSIWDRTNQVELLEKSQLVIEFPQAALDKIERSIRDTVSQFQTENDLKPIIAAARTKWVSEIIDANFLTIRNAARAKILAALD